MYKLCLNMIVKNEEENLPTLFASLKDYIDYFVICDTGSDDNTVHVIKEIMSKYKIKGEIYHHKWKNFGYNRQRALEKAVGKAEYILIIDGDEELIVEDTQFKDKLNNQLGYMVNRRLNNCLYQLPGIIYIGSQNDCGWIWKAPVHNYLEAIHRKGKHLPIIEGIYIKAGTTGGKSNRISSKEKYLNDAQLLEEELKKNPNDTRSMFYLGQSYKDAKEYDKAIEAYQKRIKMKGWSEEIFYSYLMLGRLIKNKGKDIEDFLCYYLKAYETVPRLEPIYDLVQWCRIHKRYNLGVLLGRNGLDITIPKRISLFVEQSIYQYCFIDEFSICLYWIGKYKESSFMCNLLLKSGYLPSSMVERVEKNKEFADRQL